MKTKTIWTLAFVFGLLAAGALYLTVSSNKIAPAFNPANQDTTKPKEAKPDLVYSQLPISKGNRAVSIAVNEVQGVSGFILPNDHVDVVVMVPPPEGGNESAQILLQNKKVLAVGHQAIPNDSTASNKDKKEMYKTVTLEVLPNEGSSLALASKKGTISLMLRTPGDADGVDRAHITLDKLNKGEIK